MVKKIRGTSERPRLYVFRSHKHIYANVINDMDSKTLLTISSVSPSLRSIIQASATCEASKIVGKAVAEKCIEEGIKQVVFDRGNKVYHGRIKALADSARKYGINF